MLEIEENCVSGLHFDSLLREHYIIWINLGLCTGKQVSSQEPLRGGCVVPEASELLNDQLEIPCELKRVYKDPFGLPH